MKKKDVASPLYAVVLVLILLILLFSFRTYNHYTALKSHRGYFKQPNPEIQSWMTVRSVVRHFNISENAIYQEFKLNATLSNNRLTIESLCKKNKLNCTEAIIRINALKHHD